VEPAGGRSRTDGLWTVKYLPWIAVCVLVALGVRQFFPRTVTVTETIRLPTTTDTLFITDSQIDSVYVERFRDRPVFQTDTTVLRDTVYLTRQDTLSALPFSWRLTALDAGHGLDSPTLVQGEGLAYDGALTRVQTVESYPVTLGPITEIRTDSLGIHVNFGTWPAKPKTCGAWCRISWGLGGLAAGVILWEVAR